MKWPWVSRERLVAAESDIAEWRRFTARLANDIEQERKRYDALLEKFTALRVAGAIREPRPGMELGMNEELLKMPVAKADELRDLIHERCGGDLRRRSLMLAQLKRDRLDGIDDDKIRERIETGVESAGVPL